MFRGATLVVISLTCCNDRCYTPATLNPKTTMRLLDVRTVYWMTHGSSQRLLMRGRITLDRWLHILTLCGCESLSSRGGSSYEKDRPNTNLQSDESSRESRTAEAFVLADGPCPHPLHAPPFVPRRNCTDHDFDY